MTPILALLALAASTSSAELVEVAGSGNKYPSEVQVTVGDQPVTMTLTGAGLRKKWFFSVYTIGSYVQQGAGIRDAADLAGRDCPKQLHLVLERDVKGADMAEALRTAVRANYNAPEFANELKVLTDFIGTFDIKKGDQVRLTHLPGKGLQADVEGKAQMLIENPRFSKAVWDIYLGKNNLGEAMKQALIARLR